MRNINYSVSTYQLGATKPVTAVGKKANNMFTWGMGCKRYPSFRTVNLKTMSSDIKHIYTNKRR
jgi:hypothetical protein